MNKFSAFAFSLLALLVLIVAPVNGTTTSVAFPGCVPSSPTATCVVNGDYPVNLGPEFNGVVFTYDTFTIEPSKQVYLSPSSTLTGNGGNITIIAKHINIGGLLNADGYHASPNWSFEGGTGGTITLIAKESIFTGLNGRISAKGRAGVELNCVAGNGGNGGTVKLLTVASASVTLLGQVDVSAGNGGEVDATCTTSNGTAGSPGIFDNSLFTPSVVSLSFVKVPAPSLQGGQSALVGVKALDEFGDAASQGVSWTSSDGNVATVAPVNATYANVTAKHAGDFTITATAGSIQKSLSRTVVPGSFSTIEITTPTDMELFYNEIVTFTLRGFDAGGNEVVIPPNQYSSISFEILSQSTGEGFIVSCLKSPPCSASVPPYPIQFRSGFKPGNVLTRITHAGQSHDFTFMVSMPATAVKSVLVNPVNPSVTSSNTLQFTLLGIDEDGDQAVFPATWTVASLTGSASINSNGLLTAMTAGTVNVTGAVNGVSNSTTATVIVGEPHHVSVSGVVDATADQVVSLTATLRDSFGNILTSVNNQAPSFAWSATSGTIYQNGTFVPSTTGNVSITVQLVQNSSLNGTFNVLVSPGTPVALIIPESGSTLSAGSTYLLTAIAVDQFGNQVSSTQASWNVLGGTGQATINGALVTPTKVGVITVQATSLSNTTLTGTGVLTIVPGPAASIDVQPAAPVTRPGNSISFTVDAFDSFGNKFSPSSVSWSVSNTSIATISATGVLTAVAPGAVSVTATVSGTSVSDSIVVNILQPLQAQEFPAVQLTSELPGGSVPGEQPRVSINTAPSGLTGLFTAAEADIGLILVSVVALLLIGAVAYYLGRR